MIVKSYGSKTLLEPEIGDVLAAVDLGEEHTVHDWPWGRAKRCSMHFFIETTKRGQRFVKQSNMNGRTYKPKKETYCSRAKIIQIDGKIGHVSWNRDYGHFKISIEDGKYSSGSFFDADAIVLAKHYNFV